MENEGASKVGGATCSEHGLRLAPDGSCVLCRRRAQPTATPARGRATLLVGVGVLLLGAAVVVRFVSKPKLVVEAEEPPSASAPSQVDASTMERERRLEEARRRFAERDEEECRRRASADESLGAGDDPARAPKVLEPAIRRASRSDEASPSRADAEETVRRAVSSLDIRMYATAWCGHCRRAREFFAQNAIPFREYDVETSSAAKIRARELNPRGGVPVIDIDGQVLVGFSPESVAAALSAAVERRTGLSVNGGLAR